jgi:hypothetical protein
LLAWDDFFFNMMLLSNSLAFACKELSSFRPENPNRHDFEYDLQLLGFVLLRNEVSDGNAIACLKVFHKVSFSIVFFSFHLALSDFMFTDL